MNEIKVLVEFEGKIPSVNSMYMPKRGGGKYLAPEARLFKDTVKSQLARLVNKDEYDFIKDPNATFSLSLEFIIKGGFTRRDSSNMIKATEDSVFEYLEMNDSRVVQSEQTKYNRQGGNKEFILIILKPSSIDVNKYLK